MADAMALVLRPAPAPTPPADVQKKLQKAVNKRTLDFTAPYVHWLHARMTRTPCAWAEPQLQPTFADSLDMLPPMAYVAKPASNLPRCVTV